MSKLIDITGTRFGSLTVIERAENRSGDTYWLCQCKCGNMIKVRADHLRGGKIRSCGCATNAMIANKATKHGMRKTRLYGVWNTMIQRCENQKNEEAYLYHDRGIKVCEDWHDFETFKQWALSHGYRAGLTIDRINNNDGYYPENCRWADLITQANNKRSNVHVEYMGRIQTIAQWAREFSIDYRLLWLRLKRGWDIERALTWGVAV